MRSGLATRVHKIAAHVTKRTKVFPSVICKQYDRDDSEIVGLRLGVDRFARQAGETVSQLLARARTETGCCMWAADYGDIDRWHGWSDRRDAQKRSAGGLI
jgi:hypothetical protein